MGSAVDGDLTLLHHLKESRLRLCRRTIYLVHQYDISKYRTGMEVKIRRLHVKHVGAKHIRRHQVGRKLHTTELRIDQLRQQSSQ